MKHLLDATADVLAAVAFLKSKGYTPDQEWIQDQIILLSRIYGAVKTQDQYERCMTRFFPPSGNVDLGSEFEMGEALSIM